MLAYAADAPRFAERRNSPRTLLLIVGAHALAVGVLMTTKMEVIREKFSGTEITFVDPVKPPPERVPPLDVPQSNPQPSESRIDTVPPIVPINPIGPIAVDPMPQPPIGPIAGGGAAILPQLPIQAPVRVAARFVTPDWALKPPYPAGKLEREEEATLRLRLAIDDKGRVVGVEPLGAVDPAFLSAARKHIIAKWRYKPATEDGRPVHSSTDVTLRFELEA